MELNELESAALIAFRTKRLPERLGEELEDWAIFGITQALVAARSVRVAVARMILLVSSMSSWCATQVSPSRPT